MRAAPLFFLAVVVVVGCEPMPGTSDGSTSSSTSSSSSGGTPTSSGLRTIDTQKLCSRLTTECGQAFTVAQCSKTYGPLRVTAQCNATIDKATCAELLSTTSSVSTTCFPPCSGTLATCNADGTLTFCTASGTTQTADCAASCVGDGFAAWTGTCGTTFEGQVSEKAQCWCK
jgi:hypothetical protein